MDELRWSEIVSAIRAEAEKLPNTGGMDWLLVQISDNPNDVKSERLLYAWKHGFSSHRTTHGLGILIRAAAQYLEAADDFRFAKQWISEQEHAQ